MTKLRECPFCGSEDIDTTRGCYLSHRYCTECGTLGPGGADDVEMDNAWNNRPSAPMTSVIEWTRYDGTPETLPQIVGSRSQSVVFNGQQDMLCVWAGKVQWFKADREPKTGDTWANFPTLPDPPEGQP